MVLLGEKVRKNRAPKGALRNKHIVLIADFVVVASESAERQKVH